MVQKWVRIYTAFSCVYTECRCTQKETLDKGNLGDEGTLKQKALKEKLKEEISQLKR